MQFIPCVEPKVFHNVRRRSGTRPPCRCRIRPRRIRAIPIRWSPTGRSIPTTGATSSARSGTTGIAATIGKVFVNLFETAVAQWMGKDSQLCIYHEFCGKGVALEHDGSLYSCDHYVYPEYKLGNILETSSSRMVFSEQQKKFGFAKFNYLPRQCRECKYLFRLQRRVSQEPADPHSRRRAWTELSVQRTAEVLAPHRSRREGHLPPLRAR